MSCLRKQSCLVDSVVFDSVRPHRLQPARLFCPWDSLGKNIGVGCHALLQGIFLTQGSNPGLLHCRQILYHWATREAPYIHIHTDTHTDFPGGSDSKASAYNAGDLGSIPGLGRSPREEPRGNPLQYSCLENFHRRRSLVGYSPWSLKESDTTERLLFTSLHTHTHI